jgi:hypothetical protein
VFTPVFTDGTAAARGFGAAADRQLRFGAVENDRGLNRWSTPVHRDGRAGLLPLIQPFRGRSYCNHMPAVITWVKIVTVNSNYIHTVMAEKIQTSIFASRRAGVHFTFT